MQNQLKTVPLSELTDTIGHLPPLRSFQENLELLNALSLLFDVHILTIKSVDVGYFDDEEFISLGDDHDSADETNLVFAITVEVPNVL